MIHPVPIVLGIGVATISTLLLVGLGIPSAYASCIQDEDWPHKPCLDTPPYSQEYLKQVWQKYYEFKGEDWMNMKKSEMNKTIANGTLRGWVETSSANRNVWEYYYVNGQAPDAYVWSTFELRYENKTYSVQHLTFGGEVKNVTAGNLGIQVSLQSERDGLLRVGIPKDLLNVTRISNDTSGNVPGIFEDGKVSEDYTTASRENDIIFTIPFEAGTEEVEIVGLEIPEFGSSLALLLAAMMIVGITTLKMKYRKHGS